jgi:hypothetical protein
MLNVHRDQNILSFIGVIIQLYGVYLQEVRMWEWHSQSSISGSISKSSADNSKPVFIAGLDVPYGMKA